MLQQSQGSSVSAKQQTQSSKELYGNKTNLKGQLPPLNPGNRQISHQKQIRNGDKQKHKQLPDVYFSEYENRDFMSEEKSSTQQNSGISKQAKGEPSSKGLASSPLISEDQSDKRDKKHNRELVSEIQVGVPFQIYSSFKVKSKGHSASKKNYHTEPSAQSTITENRESKNGYQKKTFSSHQILKGNSQVGRGLQNRLRPIKLNTYQRAEFFDTPEPVNINLTKESARKVPLSKSEVDLISDKLSQPKCVRCSKKNCLCHLSPHLENSAPKLGRKLKLSPVNHRAPSEKLKINHEKLQELHSRESARVNQSGLRNILKEKKTQRRKQRQHPNPSFDHSFNSNQSSIKGNHLTSGDTQSKGELERIERYHEAISNHNENYRDSEDNEDSFIKGIISGTSFEENQAKQIGKQSALEEKQRRETSPEKKTICIQTDSKGVKDTSHFQSRASKAAVNLSEQGLTAQFKLEDSTPIYSPCGDSLSNKNHTQVRTLNLALGKDQNQQRDKSEEQNKFASTKTNHSNSQLHEENGRPKKSGKEKASHSLSFCNTFRIQFCDSRFVTFKKEGEPLNDLKNISPQNKLKLTYAVISDTVDIKKESPKRDTPKNISEITDIPIILETPSAKQKAPKQSPESKLSKKVKSLASSSIRETLRNCRSSKSGKESINMFNRSHKSIGGSKRKVPFKIPEKGEEAEFIKNYKLSNPEIGEVEKLVKSEGFQVVRSEKYFFFGMTNSEGLKVGEGVEILPNEVYEGVFAFNVRQQGYLKLHEGLYSGTFLNNLRHGKGRFVWNNGEVYEGDWKMGTKNGHGVWSSADGSSRYEGEWHMNMQHGKGRFEHPTSVYEGHFKNFLKEGEGVETFPNGDKFAGFYKEGKPNGAGKYEWADGTHYEGQFVNGLRQGFGKWHEGSSSYYQGQFLQDEKHGKGTQYYKDGSYLQGVFERGEVVKAKLYDFEKNLIEEIASEGDSEKVGSEAD